MTSLGCAIALKFEKAMRVHAQIRANDTRRCVEFVLKDERRNYGTIMANHIFHEPHSRAVTFSNVGKHEFFGACSQLIDNCVIWGVKK
jgi:hypothetical protein